MRQAPIDHQAVVAQRLVGVEPSLGRDQHQIVPPPGSVDEANARAASGEYECTDWYFCKKSF